MAKAADKREYKCYLSLGSNLGNPVDNLHRATSLIQQDIAKVQSISKIYESEAWGNLELNHFSNLALSILTRLSPEDLLVSCKKIEANMGRKTASVKNYQNRIIDIDILFYENQVVNQKNLIIPHPLMKKRNFVLKPLGDICKPLTDSILGSKVDEMIKACPDKLRCWQKKGDENTEHWIKNI